MQLPSPPAVRNSLIAAALFAALPSLPAAAAEKPVMAKRCFDCHQAAPGNLRGTFDNAAFKSRSIQLKIDDSTEIVRFDPDTLKVWIKGETRDAAALREIPAGHEIRVEFTESGGTRTARLVSSKPPMQVPADKIAGTARVRELVKLGPEKGKFTLVDARPAPRFMEGAIPYAINIPDPAFDKMKALLPADKNALLIYYCGGITCALSPNSAKKAEKLGYTNVKIYHEGMPAWLKENPAVLAAKALKEAWIDKDVPHVLLDLRDQGVAQQGFIKGAVAMPAAGLEKALPGLPPLKMKPPVIVYDDNGGTTAQNAAKALNKAGYKKTALVIGGYEAWTKAGYPVEKGRPAQTVAYTPKPKPGEIAIEEFRKMAEARPADTLILDVRNRDEAAAGMIQAAVLVPDEEIGDRLAEIPKEKNIVVHCSTGVRAEMAYHKLREKGYRVRFLNANLEIDKNGVYKITAP